MARLHIVGGGLAGLAAGVRAVGAGLDVSLYEAAGRAGGRCRSYFDAKIGCVIDNGNHLLLSGNRSARAYLAEIGAAERLAGPGEAAFPFVDLKTGERWSLRPNAGPLPWWIFRPKRRVPGSRARDYLKALALLRAGESRRIGEILDTQSSLFRRFWEPLIVAALNTQPEEAAAGLLRPVLGETLLRGGRHARPLIARDSLADTFVDPALAHLEAEGADIRFNARVSGLEIARGRLGAITLAGERIALAAEDAVILAVPGRVAASLLPSLRTPPEGEAIVNAHYRLADAPAGEAIRIVGLVGGLAQWIFLRGEIASVTISAADRVAGLPSGEIAQRCWEDVRRALDLGEAALPPVRVIKEKRATFAATPEALGRRPGPKTGLENLFLAGDWTATGLPATIESAVRSGHTAAKCASARLTQGALRMTSPDSKKTATQTGGAGR